jgi:very-short-patch-repair endonuclease
MFRDLLSHLPKSNSLSLDYRPPRWESPMEQKLWYALRHLDLGVEPQARVGEDHVDLIVFGRLSSVEIIIECDAEAFHHNLIDEFRDDELVEFSSRPIVHISEKETADSSERCALEIAERWFPSMRESHGYAATRERLNGARTEHYLADDPDGYPPVGVVRHPIGDTGPSQSNRIHRDYLRYIVGNISECNFLNEKERNRIEAWKTDFAKLALPKRTFSPQELARFYILLFYKEPDLSCELQRFDRFWERRQRFNQIQEANDLEIPE